MNPSVESRLTSSGGVVVVNFAGKSRPQRRVAVPNNSSNTSEIPLVRLCGNVLVFLLAGS